MRAGRAIFHLDGYPGVGKLTVAHAMQHLAEAQGERLVVVDNHLTGNPVLSLLDLTTGPPPPEAWRLVYEIRDVVVRAVEVHSPTEWSFVFTNVLTIGDDSDVGAVDRLRRLAGARRCPYVHVVLTCDIDELVCRGTSAG